MADEVVPDAGVVCRSHHDKLTYLLRYVSTLCHAVIRAWLPCQALLVLK